MINALSNAPFTHLIIAHGANQLNLQFSVMMVEEHQLDRKGSACLAIDPAGMISCELFQRESVNVWEYVSTPMRNEWAAKTDLILHSEQEDVKASASFFIPAGL